MNVHYLPSVSDAELFLKEIDLQLKNAKPYSSEKQHLMWLLSQVSANAKFPLGDVDGAIKRMATSLIYIYSDDRAAINGFVVSHNCFNCEEYAKSAAVISGFWQKQDLKGAV